MNLMHGPQFAKKYVTEYLRDDIPRRMLQYRNGWGLDDMELPTPEKFLDYEPYALDVWPLVITIVISTGKMERIGFDGADPLYRVEYQMRTYVWARSLGSEEVTFMRDRLTTILRSALLDYPCLQAYDERKSFRAMIDESTLREEFSEVTLLKGDRNLAGAYISYSLQIDEIVARANIGVVQEIEVETRSGGVDEPIPFGPDADEPDPHA